MKYYVRVNEDIVKFKTEEAARLFAYTTLSDDKVKYVEYGVSNFEHWFGNLPIAVLKNEEA